jgi:hypothetical protein
MVVSVMPKADSRPVCEFVFSFVQGFVYDDMETDICCNRRVLSGCEPLTGKACYTLSLQLNATSAVRSILKIPKPFSLLNLSSNQSLALQAIK